MFALTAFALAYFLLPMLRTRDPRNVIPLAGTDVFHPTGHFRPSAGGELSPSVRGVVLAAIFVACIAVTVPAWCTQSRFPSTGV